MFRKSLFVVMVVITLFSISCSFKSPMSPSSGSFSENLESKIQAVWDPYIVVHPFNPILQKPHLLKLINSGNLYSVRLEGLERGGISDFSKWFQSCGVEVLGLFSNKHLRKFNVCELLTNQIIANPNINYWEIGNEVQHFIGMSPEEYISIFKKIFYHVKQNHPQITLINQAPVGNGEGADFLRRMIDSGLNDLCRNGLKIVAIHFYSYKSIRIHEFKSQIARLPISIRIWITETNCMPANWSKQIEYVENIYPQLRQALRAERIYFYVFSERSEFGLVSGLPDGMSAEYSPLMKALIQENSNSGLNAINQTQAIQVPEERITFRNFEFKKERNQKKKKRRK